MLGMSWGAGRVLRFTIRICHKVGVGLRHRWTFELEPRGHTIAAAMRSLFDEQIA